MTYILEFSKSYTYIVKYTWKILQERSYVKPQVLINLRSLKSYQASFVTITVWN